MSDETPKKRFRPLYLILLAIIAGYQVRLGLEAAGSLTRPSDMTVVAQVIRSFLSVAWLIVLMLTPSLEAVFITLFCGFAMLFLASLQEWVWYYHITTADSLWIYDVERTLGFVLISVGLVLWSRERRQDEQSLRTMSATDSLTGLYNTRFFHREMESEITRVRRYRRDLSLVLLRIDGFQAYYESRGYVEGDKVLKAMGGVVHGYLRRSDLGCRFGGDKFAVLLPETPLGGGALVAERLVQRLESVEFEDQTTGIRRFTISAGVVQLQPDDSPQSLVKRSEALLEKAEHEGGAKVLKE